MQKGKKPASMTAGGSRISSKKNKHRLGLGGPAPKMLRDLSTRGREKKRPRGLIDKALTS